MHSKNECNPFKRRKLRYASIANPIESITENSSNALTVPDTITMEKKGTRMNSISNEIINLVSEEDDVEIQFQEPCIVDSIPNYTLLHRPLLDPQTQLDLELLFDESPLHNIKQQQQQQQVRMPPSTAEDDVGDKASDSGLASSQIEHEDIHSFIQDELTDDDTDLILRRYHKITTAFNSKEKKWLLMDLSRRWHLHKSCLKAATQGLYVVNKVLHHTLNDALLFDYRIQVIGIKKSVLINEQRPHLNLQPALDVYFKTFRNTTKESALNLALQQHLVSVCANKKHWKLVFLINGRYKAYLKDAAWMMLHDIRIPTI